MSDARKSRTVRLPEGENSVLERVIERFEESWRQGKQPAIDDYLPEEAVQRREVLIELVHVDLEVRTKGGESARVER